MAEQLYPLGVRRDGSYYTRIEWASHTESDPTFWVANLIRDDTERNGGTWGAHTLGPANVVLSFFGESQVIRKIRIFRNVGLDISILEELAKTIDIYVNDTDEPRKLRRAEDDIESVPWTLIKRVDMEKAEGWQEIELDEPVSAKYVRFVLVENHGTPPEIDWTETSEIKIYG
ncbi:MAG: hypothetical protein IJP03_06810 [Christensenellaceae bacterium]|nr:hypothetical protein [Christensenellaceae bacterium]